MTTPGPKPIPTAEKKRRGNPGRRPLNANEATVKPGRPRCPMWLTAEAKKEWKRVTPLLSGAGLLTELERALLTSYCEAWATYMQACKDVATFGVVLVSKNTGQAYQGPWVNVRAMAEKQMRACAAELGMTPSSRSRITVTPQGEEEMEGKGRFFNNRLKVVG